DNAHGCCRKKTAYTFHASARNVHVLEMASCTVVGSYFPLPWSANVMVASATSDFTSTLTRPANPTSLLSHIFTSEVTSCPCTLPVDFNFIQVHSYFLSPTLMVSLPSSTFSTLASFAPPGAFGRLLIGSKGFVRSI